MTKNKKIFYGVLVGVVIVGGVILFLRTGFPTSLLPPISSIAPVVLITTDNDTYKEGENIQLHIFNELNQEILISSCPYGEGFVEIEKKNVSGEWKKMLLPIIQTICTGPKTLERQGSYYEYEWNEFMVGLDISELNPPGIYRIKFGYLSALPYSPENTQWIYSNEFTLTTNVNVSQEPKTTTDEEIMHAIWNTSGNNYEYPIILKDISLPQLLKVFPHHRFIQAELGKTLPPSYTIVATDKAAKSNVYIMPGQFNALLVDNQISIEESNLIDIAKIFALIASPEVISQLSFIDQSLINETIKGQNYQAKLTTYSKINGIEEEWKFSIQDRQVQDVVVKTIDVGVGNYIEDIESPSPPKGSLRIYNPEVYPQN